ncbi:MAG: SPOR domain-containing protein [Bacteroidia bacterium]
MLVLSVSLFGSTKRVQFFEGSFQEMRKQAIQQEKPYLVFFYTSWCNPCSNMQKYTFSSGTVSRIVKDHYLAFASDAESLDPGGNELALRFNVTFYPTILIMSHKGEELARLGGYISAEKLQEELEKHFAAASSPVSTTSPPPSTSARTSSPPVVSPAPQTSPPPVATAPASSAEGLSIESLPPGSFAVQIGAYTGFESVMEEVKWLEAKGFDAAILYFKLEGKDAFKVMVGPFSSREAALVQQKSLQTNGKKGFVVLIEN